MTDIEQLDGSPARAEAVVGAGALKPIDARVPAAGIAAESA
jgi:hypothetical protein